MEASQSQQASSPFHNPQVEKHCPKTYTAKHRNSNMHLSKEDIVMCVVSQGQLWDDCNNQISLNSFYKEKQN